MFRHGIQLWGNTSHSSVQTLRRYQSKLLRTITEAIHYRCIWMYQVIKEEFLNFSQKRQNRLLNYHLNLLAINLLNIKNEVRLVHLCQSECVYKKDKFISVLFKIFHAYKNVCCIRWCKLSRFLRYFTTVKRNKVVLNFWRIFENTSQLFFLIFSMTKKRNDHEIHNLSIKYFKN